MSAAHSMAQHATTALYGMPCITLLTAQLTECTTEPDHSALRNVLHLSTPQHAARSPTVCPSSTVAWGVFVRSGVHVTVCVCVLFCCCRRM